MFVKYRIRTSMVTASLKNTLVLLSLLVIGISSYAQQTMQNEFEGNWSSIKGAMTTL
jgi:hypothetical protein